MRIRLFTLLALAAGALLCSRPCSATISYRVSLAHPEAHLFHVTMTVPAVRDQLTVQMPAWNATYMIRDFAARVEDLQAADARGAKLAVRKADTSTWKISGGGAITITYATFWNDSGPFAAQLNDDHAFLNLAMLLLYAPDRRKEDLTLQLDDVPSSWHVATSLAKGSPRLAVPSAPSMDANSTSAEALDFSAPNYDLLVDEPIECGLFRSFSLENVSPPVSVAVHGEIWDRKELEDALTRIVNYQTQLMAGAPYRSYTFIFHIGAGNGGGMEHANSTAIGAGSTLAAIHTAAHEFFHLWNVKRIRPQSLEPIDYVHEMPTRALWFAEGVTSAYGAYTLVRTGLWTSEQFYGDIGVQITNLQSRPARLWQSVEESSLDTWFDRYTLYAQPEFSISYYNKGQLDGILLDILIRDSTDNRRSLDDVLRSLNHRFAKNGRFYNDTADIEFTAESVAGVSLKDFFARYVSGTDEIPYAEILAKAGLRISRSRSPRNEDAFAVSESPDATEKQRRIRDGILHGTTN